MITNVENCILTLPDINIVFIYEQSITCNSKQYWWDKTKYIIYFSPSAGLAIFFVKVYLFIWNSELPRKDGSSTCWFTL